MHASLPPHMAKAWEASLAFHGHSCPGLALGCRVGVDALALCGRNSPSEDEELVCVAETDSCAVDAIQAVAGCSLGKGNLLLRMHGKHAFSFYSRGDGAAARFLWSGGLRDLSREERIHIYLNAPAHTLYTIAPPRFPLPEKALLSPSLACASCGEMTAEPYLRLRDGLHFCLDCYRPHSRVAL